MREPLVVLRGIIKTPKGILLLKRSSKDSYEPGAIEFPGGKFEGGSLKSNLKREIEEETGLKGVAWGGMNLILITTQNCFLPKYAGRKIITHYFLGEKKKNYHEIKLSHEHDDFMWINQISDFANNFDTIKLKPNIQAILSSILGE